MLYTCLGTDIPLHLKVDNILVGFEDPSVLQDFASAQASNFMPRKVKDGQTVYLSHNYFGSLRSYYILPKLTDFGLAHHQKHASVLNRHPIQPDDYKAPEVILGAGWTYSADIWNLGLLVGLEPLLLLIYCWLTYVRCGTCLKTGDLFSRALDDRGRYNPTSHLAEMIALLGSPPNASEWFGGPFFDEDGKETSSI